MRETRVDLLELAEANVRLYAAEPEEIVAWAVARFGNRIILGTGFSPNSGVLFHLIHTRQPWLRAVFVNPGDVPETNLQYAKVLSDRMPTPVVKRYEPDTPLSDADREKIAAGGDARREVYERRKLPLIHRAVAEHAAHAILYGARFDQNEGRRRQNRFPIVNMTREGLVRVYPVWFKDDHFMGAYLIRHDLPVHPDGLPGGERFACGLHDDLPS